MRRKERRFNQWQSYIWTQYLSPSLDYPELLNLAKPSSKSDFENWLHLPISPMGSIRNIALLVDLTPYDFPRVKSLVIKQDGQLLLTTETTSDLMAPLIEENKNLEHLNPLIELKNQIRRQTPLISGYAGFFRVSNIEASDHDHWIDLHTIAEIQIWFVNGKECSRLRLKSGHRCILPYRPPRIEKTQHSSLQASLALYQLYLNLETYYQSVHDKHVKLSLLDFNFNEEDKGD